MGWNVEGSGPIWMQLHRQLMQRISSGVYPRGSKIPTVRELAAEAGVNPNTMQRALSQLEADGLVVTNRTAGRTVTRTGKCWPKCAASWPGSRFRPILTA